MLNADLEVTKWRWSCVELYVYLFVCLCDLKSNILSGLTHTCLCTVLCADPRLFPGSGVGGPRTVNVRPRESRGHPPSSAGRLDQDLTSRGATSAFQTWTFFLSYPFKTSQSSWAVKNKPAYLKSDISYWRTCGVKSFHLWLQKCKTACYSFEIKLHML